MYSFKKKDPTEQAIRNNSLPGNKAAASNRTNKAGRPKKKKAHQVGGIIKKDEFGIGLKLKPAERRLARAILSSICSYNTVAPEAGGKDWTGAATVPEAYGSGAHAPARPATGESSYEGKTMPHYEANSTNVAAEAVPQSTISLTADCPAMPTAAFDALKAAFDGKQGFLLHMQAEMFVALALQGAYRDILFFYRLFSEFNIRLGHPFDNLVLKLNNEINRRSNDATLQVQCDRLEYKILNNNDGCNVFNNPVPDSQFLS